MTTATSFSAGLDDRAVSRFRAHFRGQILEPGRPGYYAATRVWNGRIDRRPLLIARCAGVADVLRALEFAHRQDLPFSVRGTGHNVSGSAVCNDGVTIDLSAMKGIRVDPKGATVRAEAGVTWGELDHETQTFGLATTGGRISSTGIAGVTLGGGYGWLMRHLGLVVDNLVSADVITADGRFRNVSEAEHPELFWALRGGGGNFGIVTSFRYRLNKVGPRVTGGVIYYPLSEAQRTLAFYRELMASASDELSAQFNFLGGLPPARFVPAHLRNVRAVAIAVCHSGTPEQAERDLAPLRSFGRPLMDRVRWMRYTTLQRLFDAAGDFGRLVHTRSGHLRALDAATCDTLVEGAKGITSPLSIVMISALGGAVARRMEEETAFSFRDAPFDYAVDSVWSDPAESERHIQWTDSLATAMQPHCSGAYVNELDGQGERVREAYRPGTYARLARIKRRYDPDNLFSHNQNVKPCSGSEEEGSVHAD